MRIYLGILLSLMWGQVDGACSTTGDYLNIMAQVRDDYLLQKMLQLFQDTSMTGSQICSEIEAMIPEAKAVASQHENYADCSEEFKQGIETGIEDLQNKICTEDQLDDKAEGYIASFREYLAIDNFEDMCLSKQYFERMEICRAVASEDNPLFLHSSSQEYPEGREAITEFYMAAGRCIFREAQNEICDNTISQAQGFVFFLYMYEVLPGFQTSLDVVDEVLQIVPESGEEKRVYYGVFGDPHIYTGDNNFITCLALGFNLYYGSLLVDIYGTNEGVNNDQASILTSLSMRFKDNEDNVLAEYESGSSKAVNPSTSFKDGVSEVDLSSGGRLRIEDQGAKGTAIIYPDAGFACLIARVSNSLAMAMRVSESSMETSTGMFRQGCPGNEIDITETTRRRKRSTACEGVKEKYRDTCEYDFKVTEDQTLAAGAGSVIEDGEEVLVTYDEELITATTPSSGGTSTKAGGALILALIGSVLLMIGL